MYTRRSAGHTVGLILAGVWCLAPRVASAQSGDTDVGEVAAFGSGAFGIGAQPMAAGSAGVAFSRYGIALFQASFMPFGQHTIQPWPARSTVDHSFVYDFGVDVHIRIPVRERWAPYAIVGTGGLWNAIRQRTVDANGISVTKGYDQFNAALHTGGGVRYYIKNNWGIRSELRVIVSKQVYAQTMVGVFFVTGPEWP